MTNLDLINIVTGGEFISTEWLKQEVSSDRLAGIYADILAAQVDETEEKKTKKKGK